MTTPTRQLRAAVLTVSDRCARGERADESGPALARACAERLGATIAATDLVPDDADEIERTLRAWVRDRVDLILTTGGTGLSPRDVTPEAAGRVIDRPHPGLMELARARTGAANPRAYLSRGVAGAAERTLIVTLPGSPRGCVEQFEAIAELLPHALRVLRGEGDHPGLRP
jgi:molybdenum cofactor synthesis domain-containing protein